MATYNASLQNNNTDLEVLVDKFKNIPRSNRVILQNKTITENGTYTPDYGYNGLGNVTVNIEPGRTNDAIEDSLIYGITDYTNDRVDNIPDYAFYSRSTLLTANFQKCTSIGHHAFSSCVNLNTINAPLVKSIGSYAFAGCTSLTTANFPECTYIHSYAFYKCSNLQIVNFPNCTEIEDTAFTYCSNITKLNFPKCTHIGYRAFSSCSNIVDANFPACTTMDTYAFNYCTKLTKVSLPECTVLGAGTFDGCINLSSVTLNKCVHVGKIAFYDCTSLTSIELPLLKEIQANAFVNCSNLMTVILPRTRVVRLADSYVFESTPMSLSTLTGSFGSVYVPANLIDAYKTDTNWVTYADRITAITGSENWEIENVKVFNILYSWSGTGDHKAEEGMTWREWCDSVYNTSGFRVGSDDRIYDEDSWRQLIYADTDLFVHADDLIRENCLYEMYFDDSTWA